MSTPPVPHCSMPPLTFIIILQPEVAKQGEADHQNTATEQIVSQFCSISEHKVEHEDLGFTVVISTTNYGRTMVCWTLPACKPVPDPGVYAC